MQYRDVVSLGIAAVCASALPAAAQDAVPAAERSPLGFELTPYLAYRIGGEFESEDGETHYELHEGDAQGLIFNFNAAQPGTQWQILFGRQRTELQTQELFAGVPLLDLDADYLQFGGTYVFDGTTTRPFVALTAGLARFDPRASNLEAENFFAGSISGGVQLRADKRIGVRLETRVFATLVNNDGGLFCGFNGTTSGCAVTIHGTALYQWEASAGLVIRF